MADTRVSDFTLKIELCDRTTTRASFQHLRLSGQQHGDDPGQKNAIKRPSAADRYHRGPQRCEVPQIEQISADQHSERAGDVCHHGRLCRRQQQRRERRQDGGMKAGMAMPSPGTGRAKRFEIAATMAMPITACRG